MRRSLHSIFFICTLLGLIVFCGAAPKLTVGATETVTVEEVGLTFKARVDTGAKTTSIHAEDIQISPSEDPRGQAISFLLVNKAGESKKVSGVVAEVATIKTSEGSEERYKVPLTIIWGDTKKTVLVTLNNRERMQFALLLGRNWLHDDFIVDVDINNPD
ncbi:MAG: RimK/LysX family protein [Candidatus Marinimicrobia bacterium]|nr:RimK/LysX family protein [Candidatus Neomarinimicrobiota bacterium]